MRVIGAASRGLAAMVAEALLEDVARRGGLPTRSLAPDAIERMAREPWPGNIRALSNMLELAALMHDDLALPAKRGNRLAAANMLRMSRAALYDRLARYPDRDGSKT